MENNFEKQVKQKMEELQFTPSDELWNKVAAGIEPKQRKRRLLGFILLAAVVLISTSVWIFMKDDVKEFKETATTNSAKKTTKDLAQANKTKSNNDLTTIDDNSSSNQAEDAINSDKNNKSVTGESKDVSQFNLNLEQNSNKDIAATIAKANNSLHAAKKIRSAKKSNTTMQVQQADVDDETTSTETTLADNDKNPIEQKAIIAKNDSVSTAKDIAVIKTDSSSNKQETPNTTIQTSTIAQKLNNRKKWMIGLTASAGISGTKTNFLGVTTSSDKAARDLYSSPSTGVGSGNQGTGGTGGSTINPVPSVIKNDFSFTAGVIASKPLANRMSFYTGLQYQYYSTQMKTGVLTASTSGNTYYTNTNSKTYSNHFHVISLPTGLQYQLSKPTHLPLFVQAGISPAYIVNTNALQFSTANGTYYKDNELYKNFQLNIHASFMIAVNKKSNPLLIGPAVSYGITNLAGEGLYGNRHFSYLGIMLQKNLSKK